jgi:hypothetical protein
MEQSKNWVKYMVVSEFPAGMPWEGMEEKKQKQGTTNTRLAYILHVYQANYKWMKTLLEATSYHSANTCVLAEW